MELPVIDAKVEQLKTSISRLENVMIAYSGGVDSSLLSYYSKLILKGRASVVIAISASLAQDELAFARRQGAQFGWQVIEIHTEEVGKPEYQRNDKMRCYFCKSTLFETMQKLAAQEGIKNLAYGAIVDDLSDFRPGSIAATEYRVLAPLQEAGLTKEEIRHLAQLAGLPSWNRPQAACLSSRFPTLQAIDVTSLSQVDKAESLLRARGFRQVRVRHHNDLARIEVGSEEMPLFAAGDNLLKEIVAELKQLGYKYVALDLEGYRQGSANL